MGLDHDDVPLAIRQITDVLRLRHQIISGQPDDFSISDLKPKEY
jgi:hypothetical protein